MNGDLQEIKRYFNACDAAAPLDAYDPRYVPFDEGCPVRGDDDHSAIGFLEQTLLLWNKDEPSCQLFTGYSGSGKTTELSRLVERLKHAEDTPTYVVYIDAKEMLDLFAPIHLEDVLLVLAWKLDEEVSRLTGRDPESPDSYPRRLWDFLVKTEIGIKDIKIGGVAAELKANDSFRQKVRAAMEGRLDAFAQDAQHAMAASIDRIISVSKKGRVVVILDSLEQLRPASINEADNVEGSAVKLFMKKADKLRIPCHVIYTFPLWLQYDTASLGGLYDGDPSVLPMVKISDPISGEPFEAGRAKLRQLLEKRVRLERVLGEEKDTLVTRMIEASGGYPRDLIRLMRDILIRAGQNLPVGPTQVDRAIRKLGESYSNLVRGEDLEFLARIAVTRKLVIPDKSRIRQLNQLFQQMVVLCYRNGEPWYDLHPLVKSQPEVKAAIERFKADNSAIAAS